MQSLLFLMLVLILVVLIVITTLIWRVFGMLAQIRFWGYETSHWTRDTSSLMMKVLRWCRRPPAPPLPFLLKDEVYSNMAKIYFPFLLPEVPPVGAPVSRVVSVAFNGQTVERFEDVSLKRNRLNLWADAGTAVSVTTYTIDAAGNASDAATVTMTAEDIYPPPTPPKPELIIDELKEVEDNEVGELDIADWPEPDDEQPEPALV